MLLSTCKIIFNTFELQIKTIKMQSKTQIIQQQLLFLRGTTRP